MGKNDNKKRWHKKKRAAVWVVTPFLFHVVIGGISLGHWATCTNQPDRSLMAKLVPSAYRSHDKPL